jgi:hypothetical protein
MACPPSDCKQPNVSLINYYMEIYDQPSGVQSESSYLSAQFVRINKEMKLCPAFVPVLSVYNVPPVADLLFLYTSTYELQLVLSDPQIPLPPIPSNYPTYKLAINYNSTNKTYSGTPYFVEVTTSGQTNIIDKWAFIGPVAGTTITNYNIHPAVFSCTSTTPIFCADTKYALQKNAQDGLLILGDSSNTKASSLTVSAFTQDKAGKTQLFSVQQNRRVVSLAKISGLLLVV